MNPNLKDAVSIRRSLACVLLALTAAASMNHSLADETLEDAASELSEIVDVELPLQEETAAEGTTRYTYTLRQLGINYPMTLRGIDGTNSVNFDVRADQVVTAARLDLEYSYSPSMISDFSQLNVLVNDQVALSLPLPKETAGTVQQQTIEIPPHLITEFNLLSLQLIGHYTMACEDPKHTSLWARISNSSKLTLETRQIDLPRDLADLPLPFFDRRDASRLVLPFVFGSTPNNAELEAAGIVSSWFGALASYRGAKFPVRFKGFPEKGNAVVLLSGDTDWSGIEMDRLTGPTIAIATNPNDEYGRLLIVAGRDNAELKQAATALALGSQTLSGTRMVVNRIGELQPRKPYDAPNWIPSDRPVKLGELLDLRKMSVAGYDPGMIRIPLRLPPDLSMWQKENPKLLLRYRYTPQPVATNSSLLISVSDKFLKSLGLPSKHQMGEDNELLKLIDSNDSLIRETEVDLPLASMPPQSELQFRFMYDYIKEGDCRDIIIDNMRSSIEPDSTLDLSDYDHYVAMPNLSLFNNSGFPFTRMADLSETAVVFPTSRGEQETAAFLTILGRFGESTGYPATGVTVTDPQQVDSVRDKDLLVLASGDDQPLLQAWADHMPLNRSGLEQQYQISDLVFRARQWLSPEPEANVRPAKTDLSLSGNTQGAFFAGFESPLAGKRSVVVVGAGMPERLDDATSALLGGSDYEQQIQGSAAVVNGKRISSLVAAEEYYVGRLSFMSYIKWIFAKHMWLLVVLAGLGIALISALFYVILRARADERLKPAKEASSSDH